MRSGELVPDSMILRLILNELKVRGWLHVPGSAATMSLNSSATSSASTDFDIESYVDTPSLAGSSPSTSDDPSASFILDGFPRTAGQATQLDALIPMNLVVSLRTPASVILERIAGRWVHAPSGRVYNTTFNPPKVAGKDDVTGEPLTKRADDCEDTWRARLQKFEETSEPLLEHYAKKGVLWEVSGNSSDEISPKLFAEFAKRFAQTPTGHQSQSSTSSAMPLVPASPTPPQPPRTVAIHNPQKDDDGKDMILDITPRAANRLAQIMQKDGNPDLALRITVESGGCHGFQYLMSLTTLPSKTSNPAPNSNTEAFSQTLHSESNTPVSFTFKKTPAVKPLEEDDVIFAFTDSTSENIEASGTAKVVMDIPSLELLKGSKIDYTQELIGSQFKVVDNPLATSSCGCGTSFDVKG